MAKVRINSLLRACLQEAQAGTRQAAGRRAGQMLDEFASRFGKSGRVRELVRHGVVSERWRLKPQITEECENPVQHSVNQARPRAHLV